MAAPDNVPKAGIIEEKEVDNFNNLKLKLASLTAGADANLLPVIIAVFVILVSLVLFLISRHRRSLKRSVLLIGLCESGKTLLFSQLVYKKQIDSYTSMKENASTYYPSNRKGCLRIFDLPGYERLRMSLFDQYKTAARGIIFVIDSLTLQKELKDIAQFLYTVLSDRTVSQDAIPVLVACNKQDQTMAKSCKVIQSQLEKEMNTVRLTSAAALESTSATGNNSTFLGKQGKDFEFVHLAPLLVEFADCCAKEREDKEPELQAVEAWLQKIA